MKPNILVFLTDDHGQWASRCYGNSELMTSALDELARTGARMTRAFTPNPVCSPARASFFTGRIPSQHGIHDWLNAMEPEGREHPALQGQVLLPQLLKESGYETALIGKWHCGNASPIPPGFDRWFTHAVRQYPNHGPIKFQDQDRVVDFNGYQSHELTRQALDFMRNRPRRQDSPFFMVVGYSDTHTPYAGNPPRLVEHYRRGSFRDIPEETPSPAHGNVRLKWFDEPTQRREKLAQYYGAVTFIDEQVGRFLDELEATGQRDNTLVVYMSDHGHMNGHYGLNSKGNATIPQNLIDGSMLVPCILSWPGTIQPGIAPAMPVDHCDLFNTLLEAAGVTLSESRAREIHSPGRSYLAALRGQPQPWRDAFFGEYANVRCIRTDGYKLLVRYPGPNGHFPNELYDLHADPRENKNVIGNPQYASIAADLHRRLDEYFTRYEDPAHAGRRISELPKTCTTSSWIIPLDTQHYHG